MPEPLSQRILTSIYTNSLRGRRPTQPQSVRPSTGYQPARTKRWRQRTGRQSHPWLRSAVCAPPVSQLSRSALLRALRGMKRKKHTTNSKLSRAATPSTFTLIADFAGGTYISQRRASTPARAVASWARSFDFSIIPRVPIAALPEFRTDITSDTPVPIAGIRGVWCATALLGRRGFLLHIVRTVTTNGRNAE